MNRPTRLLLCTMVALASAALSAAQTRDTSGLEGSVRDPTGAAVAGATIVISGAALREASRTVLSEGDGTYRAPLLPSGVYEVRVTAPGFATTHRGDIVLSPDATLTVDFRLDVGPIHSDVNVRAPSPMLDVRSASAGTIVDTQMLWNLPTTRSVPDLTTLAPGVVKAFAPGAPGAIAFGGTQGSNGLVVDGLNGTDPENGEPRVVPNYNWIDHAQVVALGPDAEYGRTTGAILEVGLRSGANRPSGLMEYRTTPSSWVGRNTPDPSFAPRAILSSWDGDAQIGGPIRKNQAWLFAALAYARVADRPAGLNGPDHTLETDPAAIVKVDATPAANLRLDGAVGNTRRRIDNAQLSVYLPTSAATYRSRQSNTTGNVRLRWTAGPRTFGEVRLNGYRSPLSNDSMLPGGNAGPAPHYDLATDVGSVNTATLAKRDRTSIAISGAVTHFSDRFIGGSREFKLGFDYERTHSVDFDGYPANRSYVDYAAHPYLAYLWDGNTVEPTGKQTTLYVQDRWRPAERITMNAGVRADFNQGSVPGGGTVISTTSVSPRFGIAWDILGDHKTVLRVHYGILADPLFANHFKFRDTHAVHPLVFAQVIAPGQFVELSRDDFSSERLAPDLAAPDVRQFFTGVEHEIIAEGTVELRYVNRSFHHFIGVVDTGSLWAASSRRDPGADGIVGTADDGPMVPVFVLTNPGHSALLVTNPPAAYRRFDALQFIGRKRFSRRWQLLAGYTWARNIGNVSSYGGYANALLDHYDLGSFGGFVDPNRLVNKAVPFTSSELKGEGTYQLARAGVNLSAVFVHASGAPRQRVVIFRGISTRQEQVAVEPAVTSYLDSRSTIDTRVEKTLRMRGATLGLCLDVLNVTNQGIATLINQVSGQGFGNPFAWSDPRAFRLGIRWSF
jgi:Carboxypeptidase regulatory-like domain